MGGPRIAILYPWGHVDSQPSLINAVVLLARAGYQVDLFVRRERAFLPPRFDDPSISVIAFGNAGPLSGRMRHLRLLARSVQLASLFARLGRRHLRSRYLLVVGVDPLGLALAHHITRMLRVPLAYFSFELLLEEELTSGMERWLKAAERRAAPDVRFALVQDEIRAALLTSATGIPLERCVLVPHAPLGGPLPQRSRRWHEAFDLPESEKIVLYAGSLGAWTGIEDVVASAAEWPNGWSLVVHLRSRPQEDELAPLRDLGQERVFFSTDPVPQDELDDLFASADVGVAFYVVQTNSVYTQENLRSIGLSSGKVAYYLRAGLPVIVNEGTSISDFVRNGGSGVVVSSAGTIGKALDLLARDHDRYAAAARRLFEERLDFAGPFAEVMRRIERLPNGLAPKEQYLG